MVATFTPDGTTPIRRVAQGLPRDIVSLQVEITAGPTGGNSQRVDTQLCQWQNIDNMCWGSILTHDVTPIVLQLPNSTPALQYYAFGIFLNMDDTDTITITWYDAYERNSGTAMVTNLAPGEFAIIPMPYSEVTANPISILASANTPRLMYFVCREA